MTGTMEPLGEPLALTGAPDEGRRARRAVRERAAKVISDPDRLDDVELITAEGVANAVLHGSAPVRVHVATDGRRVRVEVSDGGPAQGVRPYRCHADHGRGLTVIDALADEWGFDQAPTRTLLWFVLSG
ncbi:ATP-binding protein [Spirillospora albida]|uniref:ATP-binding protein n=1 Tax=Spirillospora albida TaxID=58123 RepID=UPI001FDEFD56|nr:ATP-binding protein [Spirillospora albida]